MSAQNTSSAHQKTLLEFVKKFSASPDYKNLHITPLPEAQRTIAYYEFGDPEGCPLLCLHGLSVSGLAFEQHHTLFIELGIRAIAPCLLGGIYIPDPAKTIDDLTTEIIELMNVLNIDRFDVMGVSWGTLTELSLIARVPERILKAGFMGAMTPISFCDEMHVRELLKSDIYQSIQMVRYAPLLHRAVMWLFCRLPASIFINQFKDSNLSIAESNALTENSAFRKNFIRCFNECVRTGSQFFTYGWRMFMDKPNYTLTDFASIAPNIDLSLFVAEHDNVHLLYFAELIAAACAATRLNELKQSISLPHDKKFNTQMGLLQPIYMKEKCSIWMFKGAGRMACMLYFEDALKNMMRR